MDFELIYNIIQYTLLALIAICTIYIAIDRFAPDQTTADLIFKRKKDAKELSYSVETTDENWEHPSLYDQPTIKLSIIISEKNSESSISSVLERVADAMLSRSSLDPTFTWEVIVVDDFSKDNSANIVKGFSHTTPGVRLIRLNEEYGMSAALQVGACFSLGENVLFTDLRAVSNINEKLSQFEEKIANGQCDVVFGSRNEYNEASEESRDAFSSAAHAFFSASLSLIGVNSVLDPQSPFVMMTRKFLINIVTNMHTHELFAFTEIAYLAQKMNARIGEVDINWSTANERMLAKSDVISSVPELFGLILLYKVRYWSIRTPNA